MGADELTRVFVQSLIMQDMAGTGAPYQGQPGEEIDPTVIDVFRGGDDLTIRPGDVRTDPDTGLLVLTYGASVDTDPNALRRFPRIRKIKSIPPELTIRQRGKRPTHFEVMPRQPMSEERYKELLRLVELE